MSWTPQQRAMLRELGVPVFWPEAASGAALAEPAAVTNAATTPPQAAAPTAAGIEALPLPHSQALTPAPEGDAPPAPVGSAPPAISAATSAAAVPRASGLRPLAASLPGVPPATAQAELGQRPSGIDNMDWPALRTAVAGCEACGLCKSRTQAVFGVGHTSAQWMIVGEAPGEQEDKQGEPFVGRAGQLLDRMLAAVGLTRDDDEAARQVFIANVLKCRPPANRNPLPQEVAQCEPYLLRQVQLVQPKLILAMGRFAVQSLLKSSEPIGKLRGRVHDYHGVPLVVTYHPAYLLRSPADKALAWDDLCRAREVLQRGA